MDNSSNAARIRKLDEGVVNRIAAGEVIQRPAAALKEMIENSIDAGATSITVIVKDGGFKMLQVQDNGTGIQAQDLPLLCERHATSKLTAYDDLQKLHTLGFRGEALASISFVAHLTVTTMCRGQQHGLKAVYKDGVLVDPGPKPCAAVPGTTILVEDLFYNVPTRRKVLKNTNEEYSRILDIVGRYAVYCEGVGFTVKRAGEARSDLHTMPQSSALDTIRTAYGSAVAKALQPVECSVGPEPCSVGMHDVDTLSFRAKGWMSTGDHHGRKMTFVLFINGRPVDCGPLRRALEATYALVLPKAQKPWIYLDITLPRHHVDVNLHPTKSEVGFLHTDAILCVLREHVEKQLGSADTQRTFTQTLLPGAPAAVRVGPASAAPPGATSSQRALGIHDRKLVRTDPRMQTLHAFTIMPSSQTGIMPSSQTGGAAGGGDILNVTDATAVDMEVDEEGAIFTQQQLTSTAGAAADRGTVGEGTQGPTQGPTQGVPGTAAAALMHSTARRRGAARAAGPASLRADHVRLTQQPACEVAAVQELIEAVQADTHADLLEILRNHTLVGVIDLHHALVQHGTRLYLVAYTALLQDLFYQLALLRFQHVKCVAVEPPMPVGELVLQGLEAGQKLGTWQGAAAAATEAATLTTQLLQAKAPMLAECFGIRVDENGALCSLPVLLEQHVPDVARVADFVLALGRDVEWEEEGQCFHTLAQALAALYAAPPLLCEAFPSIVQETPPPNAPTTTTSPDFLTDTLPTDTLPTDTLATHPTTASTNATQPSQQQDPLLQEAREAWRQWRWTVEHVFFAALRMFLKPTKQRASDGSVVELTRTEQLYKVFERC